MEIMECKDINKKQKTWSLLEIAGYHVEEISDFKAYTQKVYDNAIMLAAVDNAGGEYSEF